MVSGTIRAGWWIESLPGAVARLSWAYWPVAPKIPRNRSTTTCFAGVGSLALTERRNGGAPCFVVAIGCRFTAAGAALALARTLGAGLLCGAASRFGATLEGAASSTFGVTGADVSGAASA